MVIGIINFLKSIFSFLCIIIIFLLFFYFLGIPIIIFINVFHMIEGFELSYRIQLMIIHTRA